MNCPQAKGPDFDFGSSAILVDLPDGRRALIAGAKSGIVYAVDPDAQGKPLWQKRVGRGGSLGGVQWGSAADANNIYVAVSDVQRRAAPPGSAAGRDSVFGVPYELDPKIGGGLFALKVESGETAWHDAASGMREARMQPRAIGGGERDSRSRIFRRRRRALARVFDHGRPDHLGRGHRARIQDRQRREGQRRLARRIRAR